MENLIFILLLASLALIILLVSIKIATSPSEFFAYILAFCLVSSLIIIPVFNEKNNTVKNEVTSHETITREIVVQSVKKGADILILTDDKNKEYILKVTDTISKIGGISENDKIIISTYKEKNDDNNKNLTNDIWYLADRQDIQEMNKKKEDK